MPLQLKMRKLSMKKTEEQCISEIIKEKDYQIDRLQGLLQDIADIIRNEDYSDQGKVNAILGIFLMETATEDDWNKLKEKYDRV